MFVRYSTCPIDLSIDVVNARRRRRTRKKMRELGEMNDDARDFQSSRCSERLDFIPQELSNRQALSLSLVPAPSQAEQMAVTIQEPEFPASVNYPTTTPHEKEVERAHSRFLSYLADQDNWSPQGEKNDVKLWKRPDADEPSRSFRNND